MEQPTAKEREELQAIVRSVEHGLLHERGSHVLLEHSRYGGYGVYLTKASGVKVALRADSVWGLCRRLEGES